MNRAGAREEDLALRFLEGRGLTLVERNVLARGGELDLVMRDGATLVIVEVRKRSHGGFGTGAESVTAKKQRRIIVATQFLLARRSELARLPLRFDVVSLDAADRVEWRRDAFDAAG